jgi:hypothetical protein
MNPSEFPVVPNAEAQAGEGVLGAGAAELVAELGVAAAARLLSSTGEAVTEAAAEASDSILGGIGEAVGNFVGEAIGGIFDAL